MINLYVKPRDFRIGTLEKHVEELRNDRLNSAPIHSHATISHPTGVQHESITDSMSAPNVVTSTDPLRCLTACYREWMDEGKTELQRKKFEETYTGKEVVWDIYIDSIDKTNYAITLWAQADRVRSSITEPRVNVKFPLSEEQRLLEYKSGDHVNVRGKIKEFFLCPVIDGFQIHKVTVDQKSAA